MIAFPFLFAAVPAWGPRRQAKVMRYLKPALVGSVGGLLLSSAVLTVEFIHAERAAASAIANCLVAGGFVCSSGVQVGGVVEVLIAFALGFAAAIIWFRRRQERPVA